VIITSGEYTLIGASIAYLGVVTSQWWNSRSASKRGAADREAAALDAQEARTTARAERRTELELTALIDVRNILDEMARTLSSYEPGIIRTSRNDVERLECIGKIQTIGQRLEIRSVGIHNAAIYKELDNYTNQTAAVSSALDYETALAAKARLSISIKEIARLLASRQEELLQ